MRTTMAAVGSIVLGVAQLVTAAQYGNFLYQTDGVTVTITGHTQWPYGVEIPSSIDGLPVTAIGPSAFEGLGITSVTIPGSVVSIGDSAFYFCTVLADVSIANGLKTMGSSAFEACVSLTNVSLPGSLTNIGNAAFRYCPSLAQTVLPGGLATIGNWAFAYCGLTNVAVPDSVTGIGIWTFAGCTNLSAVTIGNGVAAIPNQAFRECTALTNVVIGRGVTTCGFECFYGCAALQGVRFRGNAPSAGISMFTGVSNAIVYYVPGTTGWGSTFGGRPTMPWDPSGRPVRSTLSATQRFHCTYSQAAYFAFVYDYSQLQQESATSGFISSDAALAYEAQYPSAMTTHVIYLYDSASGRYTTAMAALDQVL